MKPIINVTDRQKLQQPCPEFPKNRKCRRPAVNAETSCHNTSTGPILTCTTNSSSFKETIITEPIYSKHQNFIIVIDRVFKSCNFEVNSVCV